jgi:hypothetical protein
MLFFVARGPGSSGYGKDIDIGRIFWFIQVSTNYSSNIDSTQGRDNVNTDMCHSTSFEGRNKARIQGMQLWIMVKSKKRILLYSLGRKQHSIFSFGLTP